MGCSAGATQALSTQTSDALPLSASPNAAFCMHLTTDAKSCVVQNTAQGTGPKLTTASCGQAGAKIWSAVDKMIIGAQGQCLSAVDVTPVAAGAALAPCQTGIDTQSWLFLHRRLINMGAHLCLAANDVTGVNLTRCDAADMHQLWSIDQSIGQSGTTDTTDPATTASPSGATGAAVPSQADDGLTLVWGEEFVDAASLGNFTITTGGGGFGNQELETYLAANLQVVGGELVITAKANNGQYTSGKLTSKKTMDLVKGYIEAKIQVPQAKGIWPAFWMLPTDGSVWPNGGEIDIMEAFGPQGTNTGSAHWGTYSAADAADHHSQSVQVSDMNTTEHLYGVAWQGLNLTYYVDRKAYTTVSVPKPPFSDISVFSPILNVAMGGTATQFTAPAEGSYVMKIDYIRLYQAPPSGS